jgi:hypothetical protein
VRVDICGAFRQRPRGDGVVNDVDLAVVVQPGHQRCLEHLVIRTERGDEAAVLRLQLCRRRLQFIFLLLVLLGGDIGEVLQAADPLAAVGGLVDARLERAAEGRDSDGLYVDDASAVHVEDASAVPGHGCRFVVVSVARVVRAAADPANVCADARKRAPPRAEFCSTWSRARK